MKTLRQPYEDDWRQIASHAQPARSRFLNNDTNKNTRQRNKAIYDSHAIQAFRTLTGGMTSGLTPSHQPWFKLATYDADLMEEAGVKEWLAKARGLAQEVVDTVETIDATKKTVQDVEKKLEDGKK